MNNLQIFKNPEFGQIRTVEINHEPYFVGKDVAEILGYTNPQKAIREHVDEEDKGVNEMDTPGGKQNIVCINESGLYSLVLSSKLPTAKRFKRWVTSEVLPAIRKHGAYMTPETLEEAILNPDTIIKIATELKAEREKNRELAERMERDKPKVVFADAVSVAKTSILVGDLAKLLRQNGIEIGQNRMFAWLRAHDYLISRKGSNYNMPTQRSMELGLFEIKESTLSNPDGSIRINRTPKVTGKGQQYFVNKFLNRRDVTA